MYLNGKSIAGTADGADQGLLIDISTEAHRLDAQVKASVFVSRRVHDDLLLCSDAYMLERLERIRDIVQPLRNFHIPGSDDHECSDLVKIVVIARDGDYYPIRLRRVLIAQDEVFMALVMPFESLTLGEQEADSHASVLRQQRHVIETQRSKFLRLFERKEVAIPESGFLAGANEYCREQDAELLGEEPDWAIGDHKHYAFNHSFLEIGLPAIVRETVENACKVTGTPSAYLLAISQAYAAIVGYIERHAEKAAALASGATGKERERFLTIARTCSAIAVGPPGTFLEAVQLYKFMYRIRCAYHTATIGRLDQYLYPFYRKDVEEGRTTREEAMALLCELWDLFNCGNTLTNLMLGGQDRDGRDATNELSYLMIDVALKLKKPEPYVSVRIHSSTPRRFIEKVAELHVQGIGHGTVYNDEEIIPSLVDNWIPLERARNYANDGCTEIIIDGESNIDFFNMWTALKSLELTIFNGEQNVDVYDAEHSRDPEFTRWCLEKMYWPICRTGYRSGDVTRMTSFEEVYRAFLRQYLFQIDFWIAAFENFISPSYETGLTSLVLAGTYPECRLTGADPKRGGGYKEKCLMGFVGNVPVVADSLAGIKKVVFEDRYCTMQELRAALKADFEGHEALRQRLLQAPKFGNDDDFVDQIASDIVDHLIAHFKKTRGIHGKPYLLALYTDAFVAVADLCGATPDGRKWGDSTGMHYSPVPGRARNGPTAVLRSATKASLGRACGTSPVNINLPSPSQDMAGEMSAAVSLVTAAVDLGVAVMTVARYDAEALEKAQEKPEDYPDLIVRVRGFSMRFVDLDRPMQDHIIERTRGLTAC